MKITYKYRPKKPVLIGYIVLLCVGFLLTIGRWYSVVDSNFVVFNDEIHAHISNFSLGMITYLGIGYSWVLGGMKFRYIVILGVFIVCANFICETLMGFINTTDIMDAVYGTIGAVIVFIFLLVTNRYGRIPNNA